MKERSVARDADLTSSMEHTDPTQDPQQTQPQTPEVPAGNNGQRPRLAPSDDSRGAASGGGAPRALEDAAPAKPDRGVGAPGAIEDRPDGLARDRWDVALETFGGTVLVECGAIRERVSQDLARTIFEAVKREMEARDRQAATTRFPARPRGGSRPAP